MIQVPEELKEQPKTSKTDWAQDPNADCLALAVLVGAWDTNSENDIEAISILLKDGYDTWLQKVRKILSRPESPLSIKEGILKVADRAKSELWNLLGSQILDQDLDNFGSLAIKVLKEPDPAFELPPSERYTAKLRGNVLKHSDALRKGIAEGLALLGNQPEACSRCSQGKAEGTSALAIILILAEANWVRWGSLNHLLPILAEAAPIQFLDAVDEASRQKPCPFDTLFAQESNNIVTGTNYLTGLLWGLEGLAWDKEYLVRVCVALGELASRDPGGRWSNRPLNSLVAILLPWRPQTLAPSQKHKAAVEILLQEQPDIGWKLLIQLLHGQHQVSFGSHKPRWRKAKPSNGEKGEFRQEYWQRVLFYEKLAVEVAHHDTARLSLLIQHFDKLHEPAFGQLVKVLESPAIYGLPEDQKLSIWNSLTKFTNRHRRFASSGWALSDEEITPIENAANKLAPTDPLRSHQYLFNNRDFDFYDENDGWKKQQQKLNERRETAVKEIFQQSGVEGVIRFVESVALPSQVGYALGIMADEAIEQSLLPKFLDTADNKHKDLVRGFIWRRQENNGWQWCDNIDKSGWTPMQIGQFLAYLPFTKEAWDRVDQWPEENQEEYWSRTSAHPLPATGDLAIAVERLIEHGRPYLALSCLKQPTNVDLCVRALRALPSSRESREPWYENHDSHHIAKLIKFLQSEPSVSQEDLLKIEWEQLPLLDQSKETGPKLLWGKLANDPEFFCEIIRLIYRSEKEKQPYKEPSPKAKVEAEKAFQLLDGWKTPPGTQDDGAVNAGQFRGWIQRVTTLCRESGHLEVALICIGEVLIHAPADPDGLWIDRTVASALNEPNAEKMRDGFRTGMFNSRGVHWVDPTGKPEKELAKQFRHKAEKIEDAGFHRFAGTLKELACGYEIEAERIINQYS